MSREPGSRGEESGPLLLRLANGSQVLVWSREAVAERLAEAARTLKLLPARGLRPAGLSARWPQLVRGFWETWNALEEDQRRRYGEARNRVRAVPPAAAIDAMDEALVWLTWIADRRKVRALWGKALGVRGTRLAEELGVSRETIRQWCREGLETIARRLNAPPIDRR